MARKATLQNNPSPVGDFISGKTTNLNSPNRIPPKQKKSKGIDGTISGSKSEIPQWNPDGTPLKRKQPHRRAKDPSETDSAISPPVPPQPENLAAKEKPPELTEAEKRVLAMMQKKEATRMKEDREARKEIKRLEKEERKKKKELAVLEDAAADARLAEEEAAAIQLAQEKIEKKEAKEARRIARTEKKAEATAYLAKEQNEADARLAEEENAAINLAILAQEKKEMKEAKETRRIERAEKKAEAAAALEAEQAAKEAEERKEESEMDEDEEQSDESASTSDDIDDKDSDTEDVQDQQDYLAAASRGANDDDTASVHHKRWKQRRVRITLKIEVAKDKETRLLSLQQKANKILQLGQRVEPELYLRKFEETNIPMDQDRRDWVSQFSEKELSANHFCEHLAHGLSSWIPLDRQTYYFRATLVTPMSCKLSKVLEEISHFIPESCKLSNLLSQAIFDPVKIGNLLRSNEKMTSTEDFLNELNRRAHQINPAVNFGMSYSEMRRPNGERAKDWKKATRAVQLETNDCCMREATDIALRLFPGKRTKGHKPVWGMNLVFVYDIGHADVDNLDTAQQNIDTLISRQKMHMKYENRCSSNKILPGSLEEPVYDNSNDTFRDVLMSIVSTTTDGCEGGKIFGSISFSDYQKKKEYWFTYHRKVKKEAEAIVRALPTMLKVEYALTVENLFYESAVDPSDQWNATTRTLRNAITRATDTMLVGTEDLIGMNDSDDEEKDIIEESDNITLNTAESRERQRLMGGNDEETVIDPTKRRNTKAKPSRGTEQRIEVEVIDQNDDSTVSTLGDGTAAFSTASKKDKFARKLQCGVMLETNHLVQESAKKSDKRSAEMERLLESERKRSDGLQKQMLFMQQMMEKAGLLNEENKPPSHNSSDHQSNGQNSQESILRRDQSSGGGSNSGGGGSNSGGGGSNPGGAASGPSTDAYATPLRENRSSNHFSPLADTSSTSDEEKESTKEDTSHGEYSDSIEYHTDENGQVSARRVRTYKDGHVTSRLIPPSEYENYSSNDDDDEDSAGSQGSYIASDEEEHDNKEARSITESVKSASSKLSQLRSTSSEQNQATGGDPGRED